MDVVDFKYITAIDLCNNCGRGQDQPGFKVFVDIDSKGAAFHACERCAPQFLTALEIKKATNAFILALSNKRRVEVLNKISIRSNPKKMEVYLEELNMVEPQLYHIYCSTLAGDCTLDGGEQDDLLSRFIKKIEACEFSELSDGFKAAVKNRYTYYVTLRRRGEPVLYYYEVNTDRILRCIDSIKKIPAAKATLGDKTWGIITDIEARAKRDGKITRRQFNLLERSLGQLS